MDDWARNVHSEGVTPVKLCTVQNRSTVTGNHSIIIQAGDNANITVQSTSECCRCHDDCACSCTCCKMAEADKPPVPIVPYTGSANSPSQKHNRLFDHLFKLRHNGQLKDYENYMEILQETPDFRKADVQVLVKLSDAYCVWVKGESLQKVGKLIDDVDKIIPDTDSPSELEALKTHVTLLMCLQQGKLAEGLQKSYFALQKVHHLRPGYLKGFIFSFPAYLLSLLVANESNPEAREALRRQGIEYCKLGIDSTDLESDIQHLPVTCENLKSTCHLYLAMLYLDDAFTTQTASRGRRVSTENLQAATEALKAANHSNPAPFTRTRLLLVRSDLRFRQWQEFRDVKYHKKAMRKAKRAKELAEEYNFLLETVYAKERIAFLEEQLPLDTKTVGRGC